MDKNRIDSAIDRTAERAKKQADRLSDKIDHATDRLKEKGQDLKEHAKQGASKAGRTPNRSSSCVVPSFRKAGRFFSSRPAACAGPFRAAVRRVGRFAGS